ncbi:hypothetical protein D3C71_2210080 [compost metagenome]
MTDLRQKQHVADDPSDTLQLFNARHQYIFVLFGRAFPGQGYLRLAHQVVDRRAQFMGQIIGELR